MALRKKVARQNHKTTLPKTTNAHQCAPCARKSTRCVQGSNKSPSQGNSTSSQDSSTPFLSDLSAAIENINAAISDLSGEERLQASDFRNQDEALNTNPEVRSPKSEVRPTDDGIADDLQNWLNTLQAGFQNVAALVPQLETTGLDATERRRLLGSGVRRYGFIDKVSDTAEVYPQFWPAFGASREELKTMLRDIEVLRNLLVWFRYASRVVQDLLLIEGNEAFRAAGAYYTTARDGARRKNPEAAQVYDMLKLFWHRPRRTSDEPTIPELERDVRALLRGSKDGQVTVSNESDRVIKGKKVVIDNTQRKPRGGVKVVESAQSAE
jgi:hypothetical protein